MTTQATQYVDRKPLSFAVPQVKGGTAILCQPVVAATVAYIKRANSKYFVVFTRSHGDAFTDNPAYAPVVGSVWWDEQNSVWVGEARTTTGYFHHLREALAWAVVENGHDYAIAEEG